MSQVAIFFHIPKTAGTTMRSIILRQYDSERIYKFVPERYWTSLEDFCGLPEEERRRYLLLTGHMRYGVHKCLPYPHAYFTVLRDPVDRVISMYYFILRYKEHYLHDKVVSQQLSLEDLLQNGISKEFDNWQTRTLSGHDRTDYGKCSREMLNAAIENLRQNFHVVGVTERFDETLILLKSVLGWQEPYYVRLNVTKGRPRKKETSQRTLETIQSHNQLDIELHKAANQMMDELIQQNAQGFESSLTSFRFKNKLHGFTHPVVHKLGRAYYRLQKRQLRRPT